MSQVLEFSTASGLRLGTASFDGTTITADPPVESMMAPYRRRFGDEAAFTYFSETYSNPYTRIRHIES